MNKDKVKEILRSVLPFRFLSTKALAILENSSEILNCNAGHIFMKQGDQSETRCYLLASGMVEVFDDRASQRISIIESGHYFGEWEAIFIGPRLYTIRGLGPCECVSFDGSVLIDLFKTEQAFAQAFSAILRDRQGLFRGFELFRAEVLRSLGMGHIHLNKLIPIYLTLEPALHPGSNKDTWIDFSALDYAMRRLPENVGSTFAFLIRDELPAVFEEPDLLFKPVNTDARRRSIWEVMPGKDLITVRSGLSDIMDFITCLCVYAVEVRKIRKRLYEGKVIRSIRDYLDQGNTGASSEAHFIHSLGFNQSEVSGLVRVWPRKPVQELWHVLNHREMFSIDIRRQLNQYNLKNFTQWSSQIGEAIKTLIGKDPRELDSDTGIHIVSSNTHSIANCLNPWYAENAESMLSWAQLTKHPYTEETWHNKTDLVYALARDYFKMHPDAEKAMLYKERNAGILRLEATPSTGIEAQCIDLSRGDGAAIDPSLPRQRRRQDLVINIDYAFGEQAADIIHQLLLLFGTNVRSVNFLGKAGALVGKRSDILIPTAFIEQSTHAYLAINDDPSEAAASVRERLPNTGVHVAPMLTVQGTLMQNRAMLQFYQTLWKTCGLEMEGYFYHKQVEEAKLTGLVSKTVQSRFFYYVSDLPLNSGSNLSERMRASEGIPPLYAISREILYRILT